jgi:hypothetical protein
MVLFTLTNTLWIAFLSLFCILWLERRSPNRSQYWLTFVAFSIHGLILYTVIFTARLFWGYEGPSIFFTVWSAGLIFHAVVAIAGPTIIRLVEVRRILPRNSEANNKHASG